MHFKFALPQAAWRNIFFVGKSVVLYLCYGPDLGHARREREEKTRRQQGLNIRPNRPKTCALPLSYNRCHLCIPCLILAYQLNSTTQSKQYDS